MSTQAPVIHVVDDDESMRTALANLLGAAGSRVLGYGSAAEFLLAAPGAGSGCIVVSAAVTSR